MRKIETKEDVERKDRRNKIIIGVALVVLMLFSTAGYAFFSGDKNNGATSGKVNINGKEFYNQGNYWATTIDGKSYYFTYLPNETGSISLKKSISDYSSKTVYFTEQGIAEGEIAQNFANFAGKIAFACRENENCTENWPIKNCSSNLIIINEQYAGNNLVVAEDNCVFITSNDTVRSADAFIYRVLGIN